MKAKEVLKKLKITRPTLTRYVQEGKIKAEIKENGRYVYNKKSVEELIKSNDTKNERKVIIYCREDSDKKKLGIQEKFMDTWCKMNGVEYDLMVSDIAPSGKWDQREEFLNILDMVYNGEVKTIIAYKDTTISDNIVLVKELIERNRCELVLLGEEKKQAMA